MTVFKKIAVGVCIIVLALGGSAVPAHAATTDCQANELCTWDNTWFNGVHYDYNNLLHGCIPIGPDWNDRISSVVNHYVRRVWLFEHAGCTGRVIMMSANSPWTTDTWINFWPNNSFSSIYIFSS